MDLDATHKIMHKQPATIPAKTRLPAGDVLKATWPRFALDHQQRRAQSAFTTKLQLSALSLFFPTLLSSLCLIFTYVQRGKDTLTSRTFP